MLYSVTSLESSPKGLRAVSRGAVATVTALNEAISSAGSDVIGWYVAPQGSRFLSGGSPVDLACICLSFDRYALVCPLAIRVEGPSCGLDDLPTVSVLPAPPHDGVFFQAVTLHRFGPFDAELDMAGAFVEMSLRLNGYGFSTVQANGVRVAAGGVHRLQLSSLRLAFADRYPWFVREDILRENLWVQEFVDLQVTTGRRRPRILFEYSDMMPWFCGTAEMQLAVLDHFYQQSRDRYELYVRCNPEADAFHHVRQRFGNVFYPEEEMPCCDVGFVSAQPLTMPQQLFLNDHCLRVVYTMLDCILLRSGYLAEGDPTRLDTVRSGLRYADGIITISDFSRDDYLSLFGGDRRIETCFQKTVYLSSDSGALGSDDPGQILPFDSFVLVAGNYLKHKSLEDVLRQVTSSSRNYVFMGIDAPEGLQAPNVRCYRSSFVSDEFLEALYWRCDCVVFPSQYEGFGLPITIAWRHGKKVLVCDNVLNRELYNYFGDMQSNIAFFDTFDQVECGIDELLREPFVGEFDQTWAKATEQIEEFIEDVLAKSPDWARMEERQWHYRCLAEAGAAGEHSVGFKRLINERYLQDHPVRTAAVKAPYRALRSAVHAIKGVVR